VHHSARFHAESLVAFMDKLNEESNIINTTENKILRLDKNGMATKSGGLSLLRQNFLIFRIGSAEGGERLQHCLSGLSCAV